MKETILHTAHCMQVNNYTLEDAHDVEGEEKQRNLEFFLLKKRTRSDYLFG